MFGGLEFTSSGSCFSKGWQKKQASKNRGSLCLSGGPGELPPSCCDTASGNIRRYLNGGEGISHLSGAS